MKILATLVVLLTSPLAAQDWPHLRGPAQDGRAASASLPPGDLELDVAWRAQLGPAYSGVAIADGTVVTLTSNGAVDEVVAFDARSGEARWSSALGPHYLGHDGSEDGPISSPAIGHGKVFALDAHGRFVALDLGDGSEQWSVSLTEDLGATAPEYGFTSSPLVEGQWVLLQTGGSAGRSMCAFDADSGELAWSIGDGAAAYRSPVVLDLCGRRQLLVLDDRSITGVDPKNGEVLWTHAFEGERDFLASGFATALDEQRFCVTVGRSATALRLEPTETGYRIEEQWRSRDLGQGYGAPVAHAGYLYGLNGDFLTCVDLENGRRVWKSRPPGGRGLILIGEHLAVYGAQGVVALVRATPEGFVEDARIEALTHTSYTWPAFADGRLFVRNSNELCALDFTEGSAPVQASAEQPSDTAFARFVADVEASTDKQAKIDSFMAEQDQFPILEGPYVHIVFQGEVEDLAIAGSMLDGSRADPLERIADTNFYYRTYPIEPGARWEYRFHVNFTEWRSDPLNPNSVPARWGADMSEILTPGYERETHSEGAAGEQRGRLEQHEFTSASLENSRQVQVWLPPHYDEGSESYPLLIVHRGQDWIEKGRMTTSLGNLVGESVRPVVVAFVEPIREWWFEAGGTGTEDYIAMLADELLPYLSERYRISDDPSERALMGTEGFGLTAAYGVLLRNDVFGRAAVQSVALGDVARHALFERLETGPRADAFFYVDWNRWSGRNKDRAYDYGADSRELVAAVRAAGYETAGREAFDSYGWGSWRARTDDVLTALFPLN